MDYPLNREWALALLSGVALAAACGIRAFLPLLALSIAAKLHWLALKPELAWIGQDPALWTFAIATAIEVMGDKVPTVDHALDAVGTVLRPAAAALAAYALFVDLPTPWSQIFALILGGAALGLHLGKAGLRIGSTGTTGGLGNPILSILEDLFSVGMIIVGFFLPLLLIVAVVAFFVLRARRSADRAQQNSEGSR